MKTTFEREQQCALLFQRAGDIWHLWTPENHPLIFSCRYEFISAMTITGITARLSPFVRILNFEIMSNHVHFVLAGRSEDILAFFALFKQLLEQHFHGGRYESMRTSTSRPVNLSEFKCNSRHLNDLTDVRNVIAYVNRNGYLVSPDESPYSYPWGANRYYFNPDAKTVAEACTSVSTYNELRKLIHGHAADKIERPRNVYGYACPFDFCEIELGEHMFQSASQYFHLISRSVETYKTLAKEISESIFYTDDELYSIVCGIAGRVYNAKLSELNNSAKVELAKTMHYDYNASNKQISRILKIPASFVDTMFT